MGADPLMTDRQIIFYDDIPLVKTLINYNVLGTSFAASGPGNQFFKTFDQNAVKIRLKSGHCFFIMRNRLIHVGRFRNSDKNY